MSSAVERYFGSILGGANGSGERIAAPTTILWPGHDPLFPPAWSDRVPEWFADAQVRSLPGAGHFTPLEAPGAVAAAVLERLGAPDDGGDPPGR